MVQKDSTTIKAEFNRKVTVEFNGGAITSDAGLVLYREFEKRVPFAEIIARQFHFRSKPLGHDDKLILRQMVYSSIAGYEDDADANSLRHDPLFPLLLETSTLASQPTLSRFMNFYDMSDVWAFQRGNLDVLHVVRGADGIQPTTLDFDTTDIPTHGDQQGGRNNPYYDETVRQSMLCFNDLGDCVKGTLYNGVAAASAKVVSFCKGPINHCLEQGIIPRVRADRLFGSQRLYAWLEKRGVPYYIRIRARRDEHSAADICGRTLSEDPENPGVFYGEYRGRSPRWSRERRVCVKIHTPRGQLFPDVACVVTSDETSSPMDVVEFYFDRAACENFIKEGKNGFFWKKLSHPKFSASALRLQIQILAYNVNNLMRRLCMPAELRSNHIQTIRAKIIKIGARIVRSSRRIIIRCSSACPFQNIFSQIHAAILGLKTAFI